MKSESAIRRQIHRARAALEARGADLNGRGASYASGVECALRWVILKDIDWMPIEAGWSIPPEPKP